MKKIITVLSLMVGVVASAQIKQGSITYGMSIQNSPLSSMMGDMQIILYYKNAKSLTDMSSQLYSMKTLITDTGTLTIMSAMGQKLYFKTPVLNPNSAAGKEPKIIYTAKTKEIAGYSCTKAFVITGGGQAVDTSVFWYTEKLPLIEFGKEGFLFKGLRGMPLEYEINIPQMKMTMVAKSVSTGDVPDSTFKLSTDGYTEIDPSKMLGGLQQ